MIEIEDLKPTSILRKNRLLDRIYDPFVSPVPFSRSLIGQKPEGRYTPPSAGGAANFASGSTQVLSRADSANVRVTGDFWAAGWINKTSPFGILFGKEGADIGRDYDIFLSGGSLFFSLWDNHGTRQNAISTYLYNNGTWAFVLGWYDATNQVIGASVNNGDVVTASFTGTPNASGEQLSIGGLVGDNLYCDMQADAVVYGKSPPGGIALVIDNIRSTLYGNGVGLAIKKLSTAQKTAWGVISGWDFDGSLTADAVDSQTLTNVHVVTLTTGIVPA